MRTALDGFVEDCRHQREVLLPRVPAYVALIDLLFAQFDALAPLIEPAWQGREFAIRYERPLLLLAALRFDALDAGPDHALYATVVEGRAAAPIAPAALADVLSRPEVRHSLTARAVQTNETSRGIAWLLPASLLARQAAGASLALADLGASAGLNLAADRLPSIWNDAQGARFAWPDLPSIIARRGFDLSPLDVQHGDAARWLEACVWPGENTRLARLADSIAAFRALASEPSAPRLVSARAPAIPGLLGEYAQGLPEATWVIAYQTVMRDYLSPEERALYTQGMQSWLRSREHTMWVELELLAPERVSDLNLALGLVVHLRDRSYELARTGPHPQVLQLDQAQLAELAGAL